MALVERGLAPSRARARAAVMAGLVRVDGAPAAKPGTAVSDAVTLELQPGQRYVSRGGDKLAGALEELGVQLAGARALDLGASTGGFTDCLLQAGAAEVVALDVGYGQLDWSLRQDQRVHVLERCNARHLTADLLPYAPEVVTCDLAFISVSAVWPAVAPCLGDGWRALVLAKPQFEAGREVVGRGGVVRDPQARADAVRRVAAALVDAGGRVAGLAESALPGARGNREVFLLAVDPSRPEGAGFDLEAELAGLGPA